MADMLHDRANLAQQLDDLLVTSKVRVGSFELTLADDSDLGSSSAFA